MRLKLNLIYLLIIALLISLLIYGYQINKQNSDSKKNEISNILLQLKIRNNQLTKIQKNLFKDGQNLNDIINKSEINFEKIFSDKKLVGFDNYSYSKYTTDEILFNGNRGATGTAYIDFYNNDKNLLIATYDGVFAYTNLNNLKKFKKIDSNINSLIKYDKFYFHQQYGIKDILIVKNKLFVSYIGKQDEKCYDLKIITAKLNKDYLNFKRFYNTSTCVNENNTHGFWAHQGGGGRIVCGISSPATSNRPVNTVNASNSNTDLEWLNLSFHGTKPIYHHDHHLYTYPSILLYHFDNILSIDHFYFPL